MVAVEAGFLEARDPEDDSTILGITAKSSKPQAPDCTSMPSIALDILFERGAVTAMTPLVSSESL